MLPKTVLIGWVLFALLFWIGAEPEYLHRWDEQYHALVAKNCIENPFRPALYAHPVRDSNPENWVGTDVWLEKGPVPLWGMAFSMKIFGNTPTALRLPSLVYVLLLIVVCYRFALLTGSRLSAGAAALFCSVNGMLVWLATGGLSSDHVEMAFVSRQASVSSVWNHGDKNPRAGWLWP